MKDQRVLYGVYIALILIVLHVILYSIDESQLSAFWYQAVGFIVPLIFAGMLLQREAKAGETRFGRYFLAAWIPMLVSVIIFFAYFLLLATVIDPDLYVRQMEQGIENTRAFIGDEATNEALENAQNTTPGEFVLQSLIGIVGAVIINALIALIFAAIFYAMRKKEPVQHV